jgi:hypothetical protein
LAARHAMRPIEADGRIWTHEAIENAERDFAKRLAASALARDTAAISGPVMRIA